MWGFLSSLLAAIPSAATSNAALAGFSITAIAYIATMWRVSRNKEVLANLEKLSPKDRLAALELEMGGVRLARGISPEQWVRSRIHRYYFFAFAITVILIAFLVTLLFVYRNGSANITVDLKQSSLEPDAGHGWLGFFSSPAYAQDIAGNTESDDKTLRYVYSKADKQITLTPVLEYLNSQRRGEPAVGYSSDADPFKWQFPALAVKVVNNSRQNLVLSEVVFRVKTSVRDDRPVFAVAGDSYYGMGRIVNEGWGGIEARSLQVSIKAANRCGNFDLSDSKQILLNPAANDDGNTVDEAGNVNFNIRNLVPDQLIDRNKMCSLISKGQEIPVEYLMGSCPVTRVCIHGRLDFVDKAGHPGLLNFSTISILEPEPPGARLPPSFSYDVILEAGKSDYTKRLSISQQIKPGEGDNFSLKLTTDRSASFDFDMDILAVDGSVAWTGSFSAAILVPRTAASRNGKNASIPAAAAGVNPR